VGAAAIAWYSSTVIVGRDESDIIPFELTTERSQVVLRTTQQVAVDKRNVLVVGCGNRRLQVGDVEIFYRSAHSQRSCERLPTLRNQVVVQILKGRIGEHPGVIVVDGLLEVGIVR
jgi:hypothetical protein